MDRRGVLAAFDEQIRRRPEPEPGTVVEGDDHVVRVVDFGEGWSGVTWSDLAGADVDTVDAVIAAQVDRFAAAGQRWEWKFYSYDQPLTLPARLQAAGLVPDEEEALMVAQIADLDLAVPPPQGVELVQVDDARDVQVLVRVHDQVFGGDHGAMGRAVLAGLTQQPAPVEAVVAMAGGAAVAAGRVNFHEGTDFASLWGGGTIPAWRGRGVFGSLVSDRAAVARERGFRYLQVGASADSQLILQRLGFLELATTTPLQAPGVAAFDVRPPAGDRRSSRRTWHAGDGVADSGGGFEQEGVVADQSMLLAAGIFAASSAFGAAVSLKEDVRGAPLGIDLPGSVGVHLAVGWGSGITAPWPMPALALAAAVCAGPEVRWPRPTCVGLGMAILVGTMIEPVTWARRPWSPLTAAAVSLNLLAAVALLTAGRRKTTTLQYGAPGVAPDGI
jgi:ribosomal protein S18 acetylase RimI-like enzyme